MVKFKSNSIWLLLLGTLAVVSGCCCQAIPLPGECDCPTDARRLYWSCGEEAVRRCPCGPDHEYYGLKPTSWRQWPVGWRCSQSGGIPWGCGCGDSCPCGDPIGGKPAPCNDAPVEQQPNNPLEQPTPTPVQADFSNPFRGKSNSDTARSQPPVTLPSAEPQAPSATAAATANPFSPAPKTAHEEAPQVLAPADIAMPILVAPEAAPIRVAEREKPAAKPQTPVEHSSNDNRPSKEQAIRPESKNDHSTPSKITPLGTKSDTPDKNATPTSTLVAVASLPIPTATPSNIPNSVEEQSLPTATSPAAPANSDRNEAAGTPASHDSDEKSLSDRVEQHLLNNLRM